MNTKKVHIRFCKWQGGHKVVRGVGVHGWRRLGLAAWSSSSDLAGDSNRLSAIGIGSPTVNPFKLDAIIWNKILNFLNHKTINTNIYCRFPYWHILYTKHMKGNIYTYIYIYKNEPRSGNACGSANCRCKPHLQDLCFALQTETTSSRATETKTKNKLWPSSTRDPLTKATIRLGVSESTISSSFGTEMKGFYYFLWINLKKVRNGRSSVGLIY